MVLVLPEDCLADTAAYQPMQPCAPILSQPHPPQLEQLLTTLEQSQRPMVIVGGSGWNEEACSQLADFAERFNLPVAVSFRRQMLFDHLHSHYAGDVGLGINPELAQGIQQADVVVLLNTRFSEVPSQNYTLIDIPQPQQCLIHIHSDSAELNKMYNPALAIQAAPVSLMQALTSLQSTQSQQRQQHVEDRHASYLAWSQLPTRSYPGQLQMPHVILTMRDLLPANCVITNGAGNYATWIHRFWRFRHFGSQLAPTSGSMGYGLPAAIAGSLASSDNPSEPDRTVVCMAGDGCYQMTMQELASAVQAQARIIVIVVDNGIYGTIRMHQERHYPARVSGTSMVNPDFSLLAKAYGIYSAKIESIDQFAPALAQALKATGPSLLHLVLDPETITPGQTISEIRATS